MHFLIFASSDGEKADLCHAPIGPDSVRKVLEQFNLEEGHFMVRESRNSDNAYTLSLCHNKTILNYRYQSPPSITSATSISLPSPLPSLSPFLLPELYVSRMESYPFKTETNPLPKEL